MSEPTNGEPSSFSDLEAAGGAAAQPTDDSVADGTQLPTTDDLPTEEGDAGVDDDGTEEWYGEDPSNEVPD